MKTLRVIGIAIAILSLAATFAGAGTETRLGTSGASELRIPVGVRGIALGGADIASVTGAEAMFYNPAGIAGTENKTELQFSNTQYIADMKLNYFAVSQNLGNLGFVGFSAKVLSIGDITYTTETAPDGTGEVFSPTFSTLGLTYARAMTDRVNFGGTIYYVAERILQETAAGVAFDFGFQYDTGYRGAKLGLSMKNFGPAQNFTGSDFERNLRLPEDDPQAGNRTVALGTAEYELPSYFTAGASLPLVQGTNTLTAHVLYASNSFGVDDGRIGVEWSWRGDVSLRAGYKLTSSDDDLFDVSYGAGFRVPVGSSHLTVDYAGQRVSDFFDDVQHVGVGFTF